MEAVYLRSRGTDTFLGRLVRHRLVEVITSNDCMDMARDFTR